MTIEEIKTEVLPVLRRFRIEKAALFGSVAKGTSTPESDVDMLIEMPRPYSLFEFLNVKNELEDALGKKVDLIEYANLKPRIRESALRASIKIV